MIELLRPWAFFLLPLPWLVWWLFPQRFARAVLRIPDGIRRMLVEASGRQSASFHSLNAIRLLLLAIGWSAMLIALAGPQVRVNEVVTPTGRDLLFAVDLSASMDQAETAGAVPGTTRLALVKEWTERLMQGRLGDRVGLIGFGTEAYLVAPLTFDTRAVSELLDELSIGMPGNMTDVGGAIGLAIQTFERSLAGDRVLIIVSDGEDNAGALTAIDAARLANDHRVRIYTVGLSSAIDGDGSGLLRRVSSSTGARFFSASGSQGLDLITAALDELEPVRQGPQSRFLMQDWTWLAITIALAAVAGMAWREQRSC